ncbi:MAG: cyclase family protein [Candidatus Dependentiae bacterium]
MEIIDISWPISTAITSYKNKKTVEFVPTKEFERDHARESIITLSCHTGTHVDAPAHFLEQGTTIDQLNLATLVGPCTVVDCTDLTESINKTYLEQKVDPQSNNILLFKTKNSFLNNTDLFNSNFVFLDHSGAQWCVENNIKTVGIDYLGIERGQLNHETHSILFTHGITIIEGLRLASVAEGSHTLVCLPLNIVGLEAAPARAILIKN